MEPLFSFETDYDMNTFISMARALRKTVRKNAAKEVISLGWEWPFLAWRLYFYGDLRY